MYFYTTLKKEKIFAEIFSFGYEEISNLNCFLKKRLQSDFRSAHFGFDISSLILCETQRDKETL